MGTHRSTSAYLRRLAVPLIAAALGAGVLAGCHSLPHAQAVMTGLDNVAMFTLDPDNNQIWYAERFSGEIRRRNLSTGQDTLVWTVTNINSSGEHGLFGLALHPGYPATQFLYAYATRNTGFGVINQLMKITLSGGVGTSEAVIFNDPIIAGRDGTNHVGGRILFGPDGMLYISTGEHGHLANAQDLSNEAGKIHRVTPDGGVPAGNPIAGKTIWAYGVRNSFGFDFDTVNGRLWFTDNGPECNDEVNLLVTGGNHAWGATAACATPPAAPANTNQDGPLPRFLPQHFYPSPIGITAAAFCGGCGLGAGSDNSLYVGSPNDGTIHKLALNSGRDDVSSDDVVYDHAGPIIAMETRPGQPLYFSDFGNIYKLVL